DRRGLLAGALAVFGLWLALGQQGHLETALRTLLPVLNVLRFPEKHLALWTFGLSLAAAAGLDQQRARPRWTLPILLAGLAAASATAPGEAVEGTPRLCAAAREAGAGPAGLRLINNSNLSRSIDDLEDGETWAAVTRNLFEPDSAASCGIAVAPTWAVLSNEP